MVALLLENAAKREEQFHPSWHTESDDEDEEVGHASRGRRRRMEQEIVT